MARFDVSKTDKEVKAELRNGSNVCQCASCELYFTGVQPFDRHLVHSERYPDRPPRCLTPAQMVAIGMVANANGVWKYGISKEQARGKRRAA